MTPSRTLPLAAAALLASAAVMAQSRLGELLDAGARRVSADEFRQQLVQRPLQGMLDPGITAEIVFTSQGAVEGAGTAGRGTAADMQVRGSWAFGRNDTVCAAIVLDGPTIRANLPPRCQAWYRLGERYFVTDSEADRQARVLARTVKE